MLAVNRLMERHLSGVGPAYVCTGVCDRMASTNRHKDSKSSGVLEEGDNPSRDVLCAKHQGDTDGVPPEDLMGTDRGMFATAENICLEIY